MKTKLILTTRGSALALVQANLVKNRLEAHWPELSVTLLIKKTSGDLIQDRPLREVGGKGLFVKEIEEALLKGEADFAVHSMKDVPSVLPEGLKIGVMLSREDPSDALISKNGSLLHNLSHGAVVGTGSLRRKLQLTRIRPDLVIQELRGNVDTRLRKLREQKMDAIVLAFAGLKRLGLEKEVTEKLSLICAPGQGAIGLEYREGDARIEKYLSVLQDDRTFHSVSAERVILKVLEGDCNLPFGAQAFFKGNDEILLKAFVTNSLGSLWIEHEVQGSLKDAEKLGEKLAALLLKDGAREILS